MGKKRLYEKVDHLQSVIDEYFESLTTKEGVPDTVATFSGLAYHLGFCRRATLNDYAKRDDDLCVPIKRAMLKIESGYEARLSGPNSTGAIFAMKNRGWTDKQEVELSGGIGIDNDFKIVGNNGNTGKTTSTDKDT